MPGSVRRRTEEKEIRMAGDMVGSRAELEARGMTFIGALSMAAKQGWKSTRACEKAGRPVTPDELQAADHFAMMADCYTDLCLEREGKRVRPCIPVFFRGNEEQGL